ncbi:MAG: CotH kinase family protein [Myxococcota bacterium]
MRATRGWLAAAAAVWLLACGTSGAGPVADVADAVGADAAAVADVIAAEVTPDGSALDLPVSGPDLAADLPNSEVDSAQSEVDAEPQLVEPPAGFDAALYDPNRLFEVDVTLPSADWETLRYQTRTLFDVLGPGCLDGVAHDPFTWFSATVAIDGYSREQAGVRKKGFLGSMSTEKPSLKVDFDTFVAKQQLGDVERLTLNNSVQDPAYIRQCLAFQVFEAAGVPSPRCNFASVRVNGGPRRVYVHVEPVKKDFLRRHYASDEGLLYEGALSDFRPGWMATFEQKTQEDAQTQAPLQALTAALEVPDDGLLDALDAVINLDAFITFWAAEVLVGHWDGYVGNTNNFYVYVNPDDGDRLHFIPWGVDGTFPTGEQDQGPALSRTTGELARRIFVLPAGRALIGARLGELLATAWDPQALAAEITRMDKLIRPHLGPGELQPYVAMREGVSAFVKGRRARLQGELESLSALEAGPQRTAPCLSPGGTLTATLHTRWDTLGKADPFVAGKGTAKVTFAGAGIPVVKVGALAGLEPAVTDGSLGYLQVFVQPAGDRIWVANVPVSTWALLPGAVLPVDGTGTVAYLFTIDAVTWDDPQLIGALGNGTLTIQNAAPLAGSDFDATLEATIYALGF